MKLFMEKIEETEIFYEKKFQRDIFPPWTEKFFAPPTRHMVCRPDSRWQRVEKTRKSADTEPVGRGFASGFVPAGSGAGTTSDPTGIF